MDFSGDGMPWLSTELWSVAMSDIEIDNPIYGPKLASGMVADNTEYVVSKCSEHVMMTTFPIFVCRITREHASWNQITDHGHLDLRIDLIHNLQSNFDQRIVIPRSYTLAVQSGELFGRTEMGQPHASIQATFGKWYQAILVCDRWFEYQLEESSCLKELAQHGTLGYRGHWDAKAVIDSMPRTSSTTLLIL